MAKVGGEAPIRDGWIESRVDMKEMGLQEDNAMDRKTWRYGIQCGNSADYGMH